MSTIIVLEGPDKLGKSTQAINLHKNLPSSIICKSPFDCDQTTCELIRKFLKNGLAKEEPYSFQELFCYNRMIWQLDELPLFEKHYKYIILDRWVPSTWVYGKVNGIDSEYLYELCENFIEPDYLFLFTGQPFKSKTQDSFEDEEFQKKITAKYKELDSVRWHDSIIINANQEIDKVTQDILNKIECDL